MISVLVADDHPIVRAGLRQILGEHAGTFVVDEAKDAIEAKGKTTTKHHDVILLDLTMPGSRGLDTLKDIKALKPTTPVLVLSIHPEEQFGIRALRAGASGFVSKESAPKELVNAINKVCAGGKYVSPALAERMAIELGTKEGPPHQYLSDREFDVFMAIARGESANDIGKKLTLSIKTIYAHRDRIMEKMKMTSNSEIIRYAFENDLF
ncbi:MAG: response regulator transcription factor [Dehalogenimonas sp.]